MKNSGCVCGHALVWHGWGGNVCVHPIWKRNKIEKSCGCAQYFPHDFEVKVTTERFGRIVKVSTRRKK